MTKKITNLMLNGDIYQIKEFEGWKPGVDTIAYYPLEEDYDDYSGNGYNLTNGGDVSLGQIGDKKCAYFTGSTTDSILSCNTVATIPQGDNPFTISVDVYPLAYNMNEDDVCFFGDNTNDFYTGFQIYHLNPLCAGTRGEEISAGVSVPLNTWSNITVTNQSGNIRIWLNGTLLNEGYNQVNINGTILSLGASVRHLIDGTDYLYQGYMRNFIFESRKREDDEIRLFNS